MSCSDLSICEAQQRFSARAKALAVELHPLWEQIHNNPESGFQEYLASSLLSDWLEKHGFAMQRSIAGMDTAFIGEISSGDPNASRIVFLAEYDALPEIGHACGHSLSGIASVLAGTILSELGEPGTILLIGTPAEEAVVPNAGGKLACAEAGLFDGSDAVMMAHASPQSILEVPVLARSVMEVEWHGIAAHAGAAPHKGKNALTAAILALNACNSLYQQMRGECRINSIIRSGGTLVNTIPDFASAGIQLRASSIFQLENLIQRVEDCMRSGGIAAGCDTHISYPSRPVSDMRQSRALLQIYGEMLKRLEVPFKLRDTEMCISTDAGNVSYAAPFIHPFFGLNQNDPSPLHTIRFREDCNTKEAYRAMTDAAIALAMTGWVVQTDAGARSRVKREFEKNNALAN